MAKTTLDTDYCVRYGRNVISDPQDRIAKREMITQYYADVMDVGKYDLIKYELAYINKPVTSDKSQIVYSASSLVLARIVLVVGPHLYMVPRVSVLFINDVADVVDELFELADVSFLTNEVA
jgi:hypothetical protein